MSRIKNFNQYKKTINNNAWYQAQSALKVVKNLQLHELVTYHPFTINSKNWLNSLQKHGKFEVFTLSQSKFWPNHPAFKWIGYSRVLIIVWKQSIDNDALWELMSKTPLYACSFFGTFINTNKYSLKEIYKLSKLKKSDTLLTINNELSQIINSNFFLLNNIILKLIQILLFVQIKKK